MPPATTPLALNREYGHRVRDIEHGVFTPLVPVFFNWGHGVRATVFYRHLADMLATHALGTGLHSQTIS